MAQRLRSKMYLMTIIFIVLIISIMAAEASNEQEEKRTGFALWSAAVRNPQRVLPSELKRVIADFVYYDWLNLLDVFPETTESQKFRNYVRESYQNGALAAVNISEWAGLPIEVDRCGNIIGISVHNQQLTDCAIGDLSKLPSTLKTLYFGRNNLTKLDVTALPRGMERLLLFWNRLTTFDLTKLPPALVLLNVGHNKLRSVNLDKLPQRLQVLWLDYNDLTTVNLSAVPLRMKYIVLNGNHLNDTDFNTILEDNRVTEVIGRGYQRPIV